MCSTPQNCHKSTSRPYFGILSTPFDLNKNLPNPTPPSELPESLKIKSNFKSKIYTQVNFAGGCGKLCSKHWNSELWNTGTVPRLCHA